MHCCVLALVAVIITAILKAYLPFLATITVTITITITIAITITIHIFKIIVTISVASASKTSNSKKIVKENLAVVSCYASVDDSFFKILAHIR